MEIVFLEYIFNDFERGSGYDIILAECVPYKNYTKSIRTNFLIIRTRKIRAEPAFFRVNERTKKLVLTFTTIIKAA